MCAYIKTNTNSTKSIKIFKIRQKSNFFRNFSQNFPKTDKRGPVIRLSRVGTACTYLTLAHLLQNNHKALEL